MTKQPKTATATFAAGCFWCTEAIFNQLKGVISVTSGYSGDDATSASYETVSAGQTKHAEAIQITFDPTIISYQELLTVFWGTHDPTTPNQQGADIGPQYRSAIFFHNSQQETAARTVKTELEDNHTFDPPIVTEIIPYTDFFPAEPDHQNFYNSNQQHPYCQAVIDPKLQKMRQKFAHLTKADT